MRYRMLRVRNDFHHTETTLRVPNSNILTDSQVKACRRRLCTDTCTCGGTLGERGTQDWQWELEPLAQGGYRIHFEEA